jgi:hypothetical protein
VAHSESVFGLTTTNSLVSFDSATPSTVTGPIPISGLAGGAEESVVAIDFRPATPGVLIALTRQQAGANVGRGRVYEVDPSTGVATLINSMLVNSSLVEVLLTASNPTQYGIDFNPVVNALRIVNNEDQNLRITMGGTGTTAVDVSLNPGNPTVDAIAYSNNVAGATQTTLYGLNLAPEPDNLVTIGGVNGVPSPNTGTLFIVGPMIPFGPAFVGNNGFDISGLSAIAYATFRASNTAPDTLFTINLTTGATSSLGAIGVAPGTLRDISVFAAAASVPEPTSLTFLSLGSVGLVSYAWTRRRHRRLSKTGKNYTFQM